MSTELLADLSSEELAQLDRLAKRLLRYLTNDDDIRSAFGALTSYESYCSPGGKNRAARDLIVEARKFLIGTVRDCRPTMVPSRLVGAAWRIMVIDTRYYEAFCNEHFGGFVHYDPDSRIGDPDTRISKKDYPAVINRTFRRLNTLGLDPNPELWEIPE